MACQTLLSQPVTAAEFSKHLQTVTGAAVNVAVGLDNIIAKDLEKVRKLSHQVLENTNDTIRFFYHSMAEYYAAIWIETQFLLQGKMDFAIPEGSAEFICYGQSNLRFIPGGKFLMDEGESKHEVNVKSFFIGICPVTNLEYERFAPEHKKRRDQYSSADDEPVIYVTWDDANRYCKWLSDNDKMGRQFRLPDEAEWEYACRAGSAGIYSLDIDGLEVNETNLKDYAVYKAKKTMPVKQRKPNFFGLYDMHGNVWEWCRNYYDEKKIYRVLRDGSWDHVAGSLRSSIRYGNSQDTRGNSLGFRVVVVARTP